MPCFPPPGLPGWNSPASLVLSGHYDSLPSFPPHFVSFAWRYHFCCTAVLLRRLCVPNRQPGSSLLRGLSLPLNQVETTGPPAFLGNLNCPLALLTRPRRHRLRHSLWRHIDTAPAVSTTKAVALNLSRLNHTASGLAVYASQCRLPENTTQDSLLVAGQALPGGIDYPQGSDERLPNITSLSYSFLLSQAYAAQGHAFFLVESGLRFGFC